MNKKRDADKETDIWEALSWGDDLSEKQWDYVASNPPFAREIIECFVLDKIPESLQQLQEKEVA
ncbi:MAG TPA: hypothetical protein DCP31_35780 [Cyanobacteria bacterium UBA8543]|nr:hypothetical protein [Cyanobacteria bacterium UBA8543]